MDKNPRGKSGLGPEFPRAPRSANSNVELRRLLGAALKRLCSTKLQLCSIFFQKRKWSCKIEMLKRELEQSMHERDKAMRETHDLR